MVTKNSKIKGPRFKLWLALFLIVFIIFIGLAVFSYIYTEKAYEIASPQDFIKAIEHSAETTKSYNYALTNSIEIDVADLPIEKCFYGHLNGNGYTVTIVSNDSLPMTSPIFDKIQKGAKIERLGIELRTVLGEDGNTADIAVLAKNNFGVIQDCSISIRKIFLGNKCQNAAALINNNFGEINSVCINVDVVESSQSKTSWICTFGTISTVNYAVVKNTLIRVLFNDLDIFNKLYYNQSVGYVFGKVGKDVKQSDVDSVYLFGDSSFWNFTTDATRAITSVEVKGDKPDESMLVKFMRYNGSVDNAWSASLVDKQTGFPFLSK